MSGNASLEGKVKWFNDAKGYGFIENPKGDVFVHYSVIEADGFKTLKDGETVIYELEEGGKGLHARFVRRSAQAIAQAAMQANGKSSLAQEVSVELVQDGDTPGSSSIGEDSSEANAEMSAASIIKA